MVNKKMDILVTLLPSFQHFSQFATNKQLAGVRINSAMLNGVDVENELALIPKVPTVPLYFDIKGRQLRVTEVHKNPSFLDISINHPISVKTPTIVLFKGGEDDALLSEVSDNGYRLKFHGGPQYIVNVGESLHIRDASMQVGGNQFIPQELEKIEKVKKSGIDRWFLSYVESQRDVDEFLELVGRDSEVMLKIESEKGLDYVAREFKKCDNMRLVAAKGDMYVELNRPHEILEAQKLIIAKDPDAVAGSRIMLSVIKKVPHIVQNVGEAPQIAWRIIPSPVPSNADFEQVAWLYDIGYRSFMLCDELCLRGDLLATATNALCAFRGYYAK